MFFPANRRFTLQVALLAVISLTCAAAAQTSGPFQPGGRLTPAQGDPLPNVDVTSSAVWYTPYKGGDRVPVYIGGSWASIPVTTSPTDVNGLGLSAGSKWAVNTQRDLFITSVNGTTGMLCSGPAWSSPRATTAQRGLVKINGLWVNGAGMACDTGASSAITCPQYQCTAMGSMNIGAVAGQVTNHATMGPARRRDVWNIYQQEPIRLMVLTTPMNSPYLIVPNNQYNNGPTSGAVIFGGDQGAKGVVFTGLPEVVDVQYHQNGFVYTYPGPYSVFACVGWDGICSGFWNVLGSDGTVTADSMTGSAFYSNTGATGVHEASMMVSAAVNSANGLVQLWGNLINVWPYAPDHHSRMDVFYKG